MPEVLAALTRAEVRHALVEGGPVLASAFLRAGVVDELHAYLAPVLLGGGRPAFEDVGVATLRDAARWRTVRVEQLDDDVLVVARPRVPGAQSTSADRTSTSSTRNDPVEER